MSNFTLSNNRPFDLEMDYWEKRLKGIKPLNLFTDYKRPDVQSSNKSSVGFSINQKLSKQLIAFSKQQNVTLYVTLLSAYKVLLYKYSGQGDICVGNAVIIKSNNDQRIVNALALRTEINSNDCFEKLLQRVNSTITSAREYQQVPFEKVTDVVINGHRFERNPLNQVMFVLRDEPELRNGLITRYTSKSDLTLILKKSETGLKGIIEYNTDLYREDTIHHIIDHYKLILDSIFNNKGSVGSLSILTDSEQSKLLNELNNTFRNYPKNSSLIDLFEEQVRQTPDNIALIFNNLELSYSDLNSLSNQLGDYLKKTYQIKPEDMVGIMLERGEWMIIAILGILKAGAAYVPIDPEYPQERISYMISDSACTVLINEQELNKFQLVQDQYSRGNPVTGLQAHHLVYCIYTSGSTGNPKGVLVEHRNVVNLLWGQKEFYQLTTEERILQFSTITFDPSVEQIFIALITGAALVMTGKTTLMDIKALERYIIDKKVTHVHTVPAYLTELSPEGMSHVKRIITGGESCSPLLADKWKNQCTFINEYGPTETTITSIEYKAKPDDQCPALVPIGRPVSNTRIYILDEQRQLLPYGAPGEIYIGGDGVTRGYLNRPELTAERFIEDPFRPGERMYRTGDLGRWLTDGNMEYLGRTDDQVKIRGYRIELDEIATVLQRHNKVKAATVTALTLNGTDKELVAYITGHVKPAELRDYLKEQLPSYMVPGYYVHLEAFPLTPNGKIDKKLLPLPESESVGIDKYSPPKSSTEKALVKLWSKALGVPEEIIGIKDDFFDLGGHSIKAMQLRGLIHKELGVKLQLKELFSESTIEKQVICIANKESNAYAANELVPEQPDYQVSSAQRRLWIVNHFEGAQNAYNIPYVILLEGRLDKIALKKAFKSMAYRHEILRTVFREDKTSIPRQFITGAGEYKFNLKETDLLKTPGDKQSVIDRLVDEESFGSFDLINGPLWRCHLIRIEEDKHILVMVHHHIISDGWSMDVFRKEWCAYYNAYAEGKDANLPPLRIQYKDYAAWHTKQLESDDIIPHRAYWLKQFDAELPILELPAEKERPAVKTFNGANLTAKLDKELLKKLNKTGKVLGGTLFMNLLACVNTLLYRYTGQEDIVIGSPTAGREHPDLDGQIGFYINTLALRTRFNGAGTYEELLQDIKEVTLGAYEHQLFPYDELVDTLKLPPNINRNPLFDVMVVLQNAMEQDAEFTLNGLKTSIHEAGEYHIAKFDINFIFSESKGGLDLFLEYNRDIYSTEQMKRMLTHFENIVASVVEDPKQSIAGIDFLTKEEKRLLFEEFNNTLVEYPKEKTLADIFEEQVLKTPDAVALLQHDRSMTYRELNAKANQLARYLVDSGVKKGDSIGLLVTRSFSMIIGMFGILKAGGAYVPIDPEYPIDRQQYILQNSSVTRVITDADYPLENLTSPDNIFVKLNALDLSAYDNGNLGFKIDSTQLAYTIYTSGSTGRPKGVMIEHHSAVNLVLWVNTEFNIGSDDRLLFITSMCFDLSVYDIFGMLSSGGSLVIVEQQELMDVPVLKNMMIEYGITFWDSVPTTMDCLVRELEAHDTGYLQKTLKVVFMSGDWIPVNLPDRIKKYFPNTRVISLGGATEGTVWSNFYPIKKMDSKWNSIPYGRPMNNNFFYILNEKLQPAPIGVVGELYIGGVGVARGYANDKAKTDYSFVKDPFNDKAGGRMYRTGDLGRMLPDLNMEFIGRKDDQVKIRGYRIELGEVESVLRQCELVSQAVVLAKADKDKKKRLVGYVTGKKNYDRASVISFLKSKLPDYMIPTLWVELDSIPLTSNGKIDKKALPDFNAEEQIKEQYVAPRTESEKVLVKIWEDVLKVDEIGVTHDFFDLGGHSLLAVQIVNQIKKKTGKILPISILFKYSNIESLNTYLTENSAEKETRALVPIKPTGTKMPMYFVHGVGLNVMNFADLALYLDKEQPVFGLQALGLGGKFPPINSMSEIAKIYVSEIIEHNPTGPYAIAGYSLGGFIAAEMRKQLELMNKEVKVLAIIDTYADHTDDFVFLFPKKMKRHLKKWLNRFVSFIGNPAKTIQQQRGIRLEDKQYRYDAIKLAKESGDKDYYKLMKNIRNIYYTAYQKSQLLPFNGFVYLFRANTCIHYTADKQYLGWRKYALKGVKEYEIPGDHRTMLLKPNVEEFARALQDVLDNSENNK